jgi:hypothetical protein
MQDITKSLIILLYRLQGYTYASIGQILGLTRERVRQIIQRDAPYLCHLPRKRCDFDVWLDDYFAYLDLPDFGEYSKVQQRLYKHRPELVEEQVAICKQISDLADEGLWVQAIARMTGLHFQTVRRFGVRYGIKFVKGQTARNLPPEKRKTLKRFPVK